ncbi:MAG: zinc transporter ZntB [Rhizobiaceae bacterium]|nr:zinc transporter ZntB [Rhizobiaceae bacterium]|tara:strand:- start:267204 stop:268211 length:1008 start_codon:yes stop_codon:yes gene_type:complete
MPEPAKPPEQPVEDDGLLFGCLLNGDGTAKLVGWSEVESWQESKAPLWVHLDRDSPRVQRWLRDKSGLTGATVEALLAEETRPRVFRGKRGFVTILRGVNTNPDADPEDMVAMRMWSDGQRVITIRQKRLMTPRDILAQLLETENGPKNASEVYERLIHRITERMAVIIASFDARLDDIEESLDLSQATKLRRQLSELRHETAILRRYITPQKEALNSLLIEPPDWFEDESRLRLRETTDRLLRYVEEIESARERAMVIKDDIANQLAEATNKTLYSLAIISGIFLPLAFLTGLLGINIGGMPGVENQSSFWIFCGAMVVLLGVELVIFKRLKWF